MYLSSKEEIKPALCPLQHLLYFSKTRARYNRIHDGWLSGICFSIKINLFGAKFCWSREKNKCLTQSTFPLTSIIQIISILFVKFCNNNYIQSILIAFILCLDNYSTCMISIKVGGTKLTICPPNFKKWGGLVPLPPPPSATALISRVVTECSITPINYTVFKRKRILPVVNAWIIYILTWKD